MAACRAATRSAREGSSPCRGSNAAGPLMRAGVTMRSVNARTVCTRGRTVPWRPAWRCPGLPALRRAGAAAGLGRGAPQGCRAGPCIAWPAPYAIRCTASNCYLVGTITQDHHNMCAVAHLPIQCVSHRASSDPPPRAIAASVRVLRVVSPMAMSKQRLLRCGSSAHSTARTPATRCASGHRLV